MLISRASISIAGSLLTETRFDVERELEPLAHVTTSPYVMIAHPSIAVKTVSELVALRDFELSIRYGLVAPKGTPKTALDTLSSALLGALADPTFLKRLDEFARSR